MSKFSWAKKPVGQDTSSKRPAVRSAGQAGKRQRGKTTRRRWGIPLAVGAGLAIGLVVLAIQGTHPSGPRSAASVDQQVASVRLTYWDGSRGTLADFKGKPLVVNFWASWCGACLAELPRFQQVYLKHRDQLAFLGVNLKDDPQQADQLRQRTGITFRLARDNDGSVFQAFGGYTTPTTVLIGADGKVRHTFNGEINAEELEAAIQQYLLPPA